VLRGGAFPTTTKATLSAAKKPTAKLLKIHLNVSYVEGASKNGTTCRMRNIKY